MMFLIRILGKSIISHSVCLLANLFCQRHICAHIATVEQRLHKTFRNTDFEKVLRRRTDTFSTRIIVLVLVVALFSRIIAIKSVDKKSTLARL